MSRKPPEGMHWCPTCGEPLRVGTVHETVERVVRAGQHYGSAQTGAGAIVKVEPRYVNDPNVVKATMSLDEAAMLRAHREQKTTAAKQPPRLLQAVVGGLAGAISATRQQIERGKQVLQRNAEKATERADEAKRG